jgi:hypothetical protein
MLAYGRDYLATVLAVLTTPLPSLPPAPRRHARRTDVPTDIRANLIRLRHFPVPLAWHLRELHDIGDYTYRALGDVLGLTGERVGQLAGKAKPVTGTPRVESPPPPPSIVPPMKPPPVVTAEIAAELADLQGKAVQVRGHTGRDDPRRAASETLSRRLAELRKAGATYRELGDALGVREGTVRARLQTHGYQRRPPSRKVYGTPIAPKIRTQTPVDRSVLLTYIATAGAAGRTRTEIHRDHYKHGVPAGEINAALAELVNDGRVREQTEYGRRGRPPTRYFA